MLIDGGETEVLIDAGSAKGSATTIKTYIDKYVDGDLDYVISTHSDEDHIAALIGSKSGNSRSGILYQYSVGTFIRFDKSGKDGNGKPVETDKGNKTLYGEYLDAVAYAKAQGTNVYTASQCYEEKDGAKRQYYLDANHTISFNILYNYYYYNASSDENNYSVVTLLTQELVGGNKHYLFTGDLEEDGESKMVEYYANASNSKSAYDILPEVELYKAGHHGSKTSSTAKLLNVIKPKYVAVCCCCGSPEYTKENNNTFPTQTMIDNVGKFTDKIYVTSIATDLPEKDDKGNYKSQSFGGFKSMNGNIVFYSKSDKLKLWCSDNDTVLKDTDWFKENRTWSGV
ncbi:MAG: MBL fold metallo-hydrolase [Clostridia bacterium]|nr:MBL fold metallo-hydrolase [Clostridia bacterium]